MKQTELNLPDPIFGFSFVADVEAPRADGVQFMHVEIARAGEFFEVARVCFKQEPQSQGWDDPADARHVVRDNLDLATAIITVRQEHIRARREGFYVMNPAAVYYDNGVETIAEQIGLSQKPTIAAAAGLSGADRPAYPETLSHRRRAPG